MVGKYEERGADDCWPWIAGRDRKGYGVIGRGGRGSGQDRAHRVMARIHLGEIEGKVVMHLCNNPPCVNPKHLKIGTQSENIRQMWAQGRIHPSQKRKRGDQKRSLDKVTVALVKKRYANGESQQSIADDLGVHQATISRAVLGRYDD